METVYVGCSPQNVSGAIKPVAAGGNRVQGIAVPFVSLYPVRQNKTLPVDPSGLHAERCKNFLLHIIRIRHAGYVFDNQRTKDKIDIAVSGIRTRSKISGIIAQEGQMFPKVLQPGRGIF